MYVFRFLQTAHSKTSADNLPWKNAAVAMVRTENNSFDSQKFVLFCFVLFLCFKPLLIAGTYFLFRLEWRRIWFAMTATKWNFLFDKYISAWQGTIYDLQRFKASTSFLLFSSIEKQKLQYSITNYCKEFCQCNFKLHHSFWV